MTRVAERLSARTAQTVKDRGLYADGKGLYLRIGPTGAKSWIYRYRSDGQRHDLGLGPYPDISLAEARERATEQRKLRLSGHDPLLTRRAGKDQARLAAAKAMTFRQSAEAYMAAHRAGWKNPMHAHQWTASLQNYAYPVLGNLPVAAIDVGLVLKVIEPIWTTRPETASRVRGRVELVLDWATARGYRQGDNPARWRGHLDKLLPRTSKVHRVKHHAALPYSEVASFMAALRRQEGSAARGLELAILTAARSGEAMGARWSEFDLKGKLWTVPADRMKGQREHRVPLSDAAVAILEGLERSGEYVFPSPRRDGALTNMAHQRLLARMGYSVTPHGFRSTFRDWAAECTAFPAEVAEMALAHTVGDKVEAAYRRGDLFEKRRQIMEAWARYCSAPATAGDNVVAIGAVA